MKMNAQVGMMFLATVVLFSGCGKSGDETANARSSAPKQVSKWKHQPKSATAGSMGMVLETQGTNVTAISIHGLKAGPGFVADSGLSAGKFLVRQGAIVLPIGLPPFATVEDWLANNGSYWEVHFKPGGTNVMATIKSMGVPEHPIEFLPFQE